MLDSNWKSDSEYWMGIDLGTIYSCIGIIRKDQIEKVADKADGSRIIPSMVCYKESKWLYGNSAKINMVEYYKITMFESKRLLGLNLKIKKYKMILKIGQIKLLKIQ